MDKIFEASATSLVAIVLTAIGIYFTVIILTRIAGKRSFSKISSFDFAMTISIGALIATTILSPSVSLLQGVVGLTAIFILEIISSSLRKFSFYRKAVDNSPLLLMKGPEILEENLKKVKITKADLFANLRQANVLRLSQVKAVVFENTGEISVLHTSAENIELEELLLDDVKRG